jgi:hypothetical protein
MMIDPTARVEDGAVIGEGTVIGPYCMASAPTEQVSSPGGVIAGGGVRNWNGAYGRRPHHRGTAGSNKGVGEEAGR